MVVCVYGMIYLLILVKLFSPDIRSFLDPIHQTSFPNVYEIKFAKNAPDLRKVNYPNYRELLFVQTIFLGYASESENLWSQSFEIMQRLSILSFENFKNHLTPNLFNIDVAFNSVLSHT